jgi:hypothetical protein
MLAEWDAERAPYDWEIEQRQADAEPTEQAGPEVEPAAGALGADAAPAPQTSVRVFVPWRIKPSAYVDLGTGEGIVDGGERFTVRKRGKLASLAELLRAVPDAVKYVHLTGTLPEDGRAAALDTWAHGKLPKGWDTSNRDHDSDDERDRVSLRYRRPDRTQLTIYRAAGWIGDAEATTTPGELAAAVALTTTGLAETFGSVCADPYGVPLKSTPAATGLELIRRTLPTGKEFEMLGEPMQRLIRAVGGQARTEDYAARTHPSGGHHIPDELPGLYVYDMRWCYAALLDLEMPCGPVEFDEVPEFAYRDGGKGWVPCLYQVRVTVPEGWDSVGRFRRRAGDNDVWEYPCEPGETFTAWAWERALINADRDGWRLGEHVQIMKRFQFTGPKVKPLATFGRHMRALREEWIPAQNDAPARVRELARVMARQITIAAIGKLSGTPYAKLRTVPVDSPDRPADAWLSEDEQRWEWRELTAGRAYLVHPEWSAYIWAVAREWLMDHPAQKGVGLRHVPRSELIAARTDGYWTSTPQPVIDTGRIGHFRVQLEHDGPIPTPRTVAELNATRKRLIDARDAEAVTE